MARIPSFPEISPISPKPALLTKNNIFEFAERIASVLDYRPRHVSIKDIVVNLGGRIAFKNYLAADFDKPESLHVKSFGNFTIFIPEHTSTARDNFTIAHELGHYILHYLPRVSRDSNVEFVAYRYGTPEVDERTEWEANWFAAAFLMPTEEFRTCFDSSKGSILLVAEYFSVSTNAAEVRAKDLGLKN